MRGTLVIYRRELGSLFLAPLAWILLFVALLLNGLLFSLYLSQSRDVTAALEFVFGVGLFFWFFMVVLAPLLAMRLLAEEAASGTLEYLRTAPVSDAAVVTGKFLAGLTFMALLWSSSFLYAAAVQVWGVPPDWGQVLATFVGMVLASAVLVALSLAACTLSATPLLAAFLALMACLWWLALPLLVGALLGQMGVVLAKLGDAGAVEAALRGMLERMDVMQHFFRSYSRGVVDSGEVVFFLTWTAFFLFLTTRALEAKRWRG